MTKMMTTTEEGATTFSPTTSMKTLLLIDNKRCKNRLLKVCYVPGTSTAHNRLLFLFLLRLFTVLMKQTKQSIFLDVYASASMEQRTFKNVNNYLNTNIYYYLKTSGGKSYNVYLNVVHFSTPELIRHLWQL
jgi:hypothetical protein